MVWQGQRNIFEIVDPRTTDENGILQGKDSLSVYGKRQSATVRRLLSWYTRAKRDLPWRRTRDPYRILVSEIMLQQTRVNAVIPYYERFLDRFPSVEALAEAPEAALLNAWAGLGYYSRARNLKKTARLVAAAGEFPRDYDGLLALPGVGPYTAAALASICFGLPHAVLDGNVMRVLARMLNDSGDLREPTTRRRLEEAANRLLDQRDPALFNQAMMELGATVCLPRRPQCLVCPLANVCNARRLGRQLELPVKSKAKETVYLRRTVLLIRRRGRILLRQRPASSSLMPGFWELPESGDVPGAVEKGEIGTFRHSVTHHNYTFAVHSACVTGTPRGFYWKSEKVLHEIPLSTTAKKAMLCLGRKKA